MFFEVKVLHFDVFRSHSFPRLDSDQQNPMLVFMKIDLKLDLKNVNSPGEHISNTSSVFSYISLVTLCNLFLASFFNFETVDKE